MSPDTSSPGPARYNPKPDVNGPFWPFGIKTKINSDSIPGPGEYDPAVERVKDKP